MTKTLIRVTLTEAVTAHVADKDRVSCADVADAVRGVVGYRPGEAAVSRVLARLGWERVIVSAAGKVGFRRPN